MSKVTGVNDIRSNIDTLKRQMDANVVKGLIAGGLLVKKDSQKETPRRQGNLITGHYVIAPNGSGDNGGGFTGEDSGKLGTSHDSVLRNSQRTVAGMSTGSKATVAVGATPFYALIVHENPRAGAAGYEPSKDKAGLKAERVHSRVGGYKFLEKALNGAGSRVKQAIAAAAKLPPGPVRA